MATNTATSSGWLSRERTIAGPQFNRWLVPPAALAIHLCIGMSYGFSVFWLPMSHLLPTAAAAACGAQSLTAALASTDCNWSVPTFTHIFEIFIAVLGISAAVWGGWLEHAGPRKGGLVAATCFAASSIDASSAIRAGAAPRRVFRVTAQSAKALAYLAASNFQSQHQHSLLYPMFGSTGRWRRGRDFNRRTCNLRRTRLMASSPLQPAACNAE